MSTESKHAERRRLRFVWNGLSRGSTGARILVGRIIRRLFGLASFDRLAGNGLVGVAGEYRSNGWVRGKDDLHVQTRPTVMRLSLDLKSQPEIAPLNVHPFSEYVTKGVGGVDSYHRGSSILKLPARPDARATF